MICKLESDRATESPARMIAKLCMYLDLWKELRAVDPQAKPFRVLFATTTQARGQSVRKGVLDRIGPSALFLFTHEGMYTPDHPETILGRIWRTAAADEPLKLLA